MRPNSQPVGNTDGTEKRLVNGFFVQKLCMLRTLTMPAHRTYLNPKFKDKMVSQAQLDTSSEHLGFRKTRAKRPLSKKRVLSINRTGNQQKLSVTIE